MAELVSIALILLFGTLCSAVAYRLKVSNVFFLVLAGMIFGMFNFVNLGNEATIIISELALIMVVFDATSRLNFKEVLKYSKESIKLTAIFLIISVAVMATIYSGLFNGGMLVAVLFSVMMYGIDPAVALSVLKGKKDKIIDILEIESIMNTPLTLILSILIIDSMKGLDVLFEDQIILIMQQLFVPVGVGVILGLIIVHIMKHDYFEELSHLMVITAAVVVYVLAEIMNGNGVLAVTTFGLIFGNYHVKHKLELEKFASIFAGTLKILVFVLLGTLIVQYSGMRTAEEFFFGSLLFLVYLGLRFISVELSLKGISLRKKIFMTINIPKGIDVAVILLLLISSGLKGIGTLINISLLFVLYSIVVGTVGSLFNDWFFEKK